MKVTLIDYGAGNVTSVQRALARLGADVERTSNPAMIDMAQCLVLPGVGHFAALIAALDTGNLRAPLQSALRRGTPFLGICLGLQALFEFSEEAPDKPGLGQFPGCVSHLPELVKLPHMGWNQLSRNRPSKLLERISPEAYFYFAHSYAAPAGKEESVAGCCYGREFTAVLEQNNIFGVQFHPEKSGAPGARLLQNFLQTAAA